MILFLFMIALLPSVFSQIPNSGFENWTNMGNYDIPVSWGNLNAITNPAGFYTCLKGTPGNPGTAYLKLISKTVSGMGVQPGIAVSGALNAATYQAVSGFAYADRPVSLNGKWQYMASGSDQGYIAVYLTRWNSGPGSRDTVGKALYLLPGMIMLWQNFTIPLTYMNSDIPDSAMIIFSASGSTPESGSYLYIDNLSFFGGTVGMEDPGVSQNLMVYPNPSMQGKLMVDLRNRDNVGDYLDILDLLGKTISHLKISGHTFPFSMDVSALPAGEYQLRIYLKSGTFVSKFIKK